MNWYQQQEQSRQQLEEMLRKMEGEVEQGRVIRKNALQQIIETEKVMKHEIRTNETSF